MLWLLVLLLGLAVRGLTMQFVRAHFNDPGWFQYGSYAVFDERARAILDGRERAFWIDDPTRTDLVQYPPAYPMWLAAVYRATGEPSIYAVQTLQWILDSVLVMLLVAGISVTAYGWRAGLAASFVAAFSPVLAMYGAWPTADAPTTWFVLGGVWLMLLAAKRRSLPCACLAGLLVGLACWLRVNPLYLAVPWALALLFFVRASWRRRMILSAALLFSALLVVSPIMIRNYLVFPDFTPTGGTLGVNLWEGLGETELGRANGFVLGDDKILEVERERLRLSLDFPLKHFWPDGIRRDRERVRESVAFIKQHPIWYAGVMMRRIWGMLKVAGEPVPYTGSAGINVTSRKCLTIEWQGGALALAVNLLGMFQSVVRYLYLPLTVLGLWLAARRDFFTAALILTTVLYYLVPGSFAHTEMRYALPVHGLLPVFAGLGALGLADTFRAVMRRGRKLAASG